MLILFKPGNRAYGELVCRDAQESDQGAYSCEAINSKGACFAGSTGCGQPGQVCFYCGGLRFIENKQKLLSNYLQKNNHTTLWLLF